MGSVLMIVRDVIGKESPQMSLVQGDYVVRQLPTQRSATPFCQGLPTEVCTGLIFIDSMLADTANPYFES
jgi:hypothetical protein